MPILPFNAGPVQWIADDGVNWFVPTGPFQFHGLRTNPKYRRTRQKATWAARLIVGLSVGEKPTWTTDDVVQVVKGAWSYSASFVTQKGLWGREAGRVEEDSVQVLIVNTGPPMPVKRFRAAMIKVVQDKKRKSRKRAR